MKTTLAFLFLLVSCGKTETINNHTNIIERSHTETIYLSFQFEKVQTNVNTFMLESGRCNSTTTIPFQFKMPSKSISGTCQSNSITSIQQIGSVSDKVDVIVYKGDLVSVTQFVGSSVYSKDISQFGTISEAYLGVRMKVGSSEFLTCDGEMSCTETSQDIFDMF